MVDLDVDSIKYIKSSTLKASQVRHPAHSAEGSSALTPDYLSFRNTWWGQPQPVSYNFIWKAFLEDPIVRSCVDFTVDAITGDGYVLEGEKQSHVKKVWDVFRKSDAQAFLHDMVYSLVIFGDSYAEKIRKANGLLEYMRPVDSASIRIDYDERGRELQYIQRVLHRRVNFSPDEMVHFRLNSIGGRVYGNTAIQSIIFTIRAKMSAQNYNTEYFRRPGLPRSLYISKNLSESQNKRIISELKQATAQTDIWLNASGGEINHETIAPSNQDMQFVELMNFLRQEIIAAMGVPPIFLGISEGSNRSNSQTQLEAWDRKKKKMRLVIQDIINRHILNTANFGFDDVYFKFNDENSRERLKYGQLAQLMSTTNFVTPNQILDAMNLPKLDDKKIRVDSFTGEMDKPTNSVGDTPLYIINQSMQNNASNNNPNAANPQRSQDKDDNAQRLNTEQANETRGKNITKADDYGYGAYPVEQYTTSRSAWEAMESRFKRNMEVLNQVMANHNPEFEQMDAQFGPKKTRPKRKGLGDTATFYRGMTQLEE